MILLTGATGQVGTALAPRLAQLDDVVAPGRRDFDLSRPASLAGALDRLAPSVIVNLAAFTDVDGAEDHEDEATAVNGAAVDVLTGWAAANGGWVLTMSSDYVFDGRGDRPLLEGDPTAPINAYGRSKLVGERAALATDAALVVRTSWVVSATHPNFVATMLSLLDRGVDPQVVDDQHGRPTVADDLSMRLAELVQVRPTGLVQARPTGLVHLANAGTTTWCGLAREVARLAGTDVGRITACGTDEFPTPARRPAWSVLGSRRLAELGLDPLPPWRESLPAVVAAQLGCATSIPPVGGD